MKPVCNHFSTKFGALMGKNNLEAMAQNQNRLNLKIPMKGELSYHLFKCIHSKNVIYIKQKAVTISIS